MQRTQEQRAMPEDIAQMTKQHTKPTQMSSVSELVGCNIPTAPVEQEEASGEAPACDSTAGSNVEGNATGFDDS